MINQRKSPILDEEIQEYLEIKQLDLKAVCDREEAVEGVEYIIISIPTNYDSDQNYLIPLR